MLQFPSPDHQRIYTLYHYLFTGLAMVRRREQPNYQAISDRLSTNKEFRRTVSELFSLFQQEAEGKDDIELSKPLQNRLARVTTGDIVKMLGHLDNRLKTDYREHNSTYLSVLHPDDSLAILYRLIELTPEERKLLGLANSDNLVLIQQAFLALQQSGGSQNNALVSQLYQQAIGFQSSDATPLYSLEDVDEHIHSTVEGMLTYLPRRPHRTRTPEGLGTDLLQSELTQKVQREVRRILARSGNQHSPVGGNDSIDAYICHYFDRTFITKLAQTVVANERLTDQFPVHLKRVSIQPCGPLPFADKKLGSLRTTDDAYWALLHPTFHQLDQGMLLNPITELYAPGDYELASQGATQVTVEFYIKVPPDYVPAVPHVFKQLASERGDRIDFSLSNTGIGGALSHTVKTINLALMRDIPCLEAYFSIAHDVTSTQKIIRDNVPSPVWAHNLVKLCPKQTLGEALMKWTDEPFHSYSDYAFAEPIGRGDYCECDFFQVQAQAALHARLQAIRHTGVHPNIYLHELCHRTEQRVALQDAWSYLKGYPFSSFAMLGAIEQDVLQPNVGDRPLTLQDPYVYFEAYLSIVEALLDEGGYRRARRYLDKVVVLDKVVQQGLAIADPNSSSSPPSFEVFSGSVVVRYLICLANYYYLYDTHDTDPRYRPLRCPKEINRESLVQRAWYTLDEAQTHIQLRLRKYVLINEISQATFHPHYLLLSRIAFLRTKLLIFFARFVPRQPKLHIDQFSGPHRSVAATHWGRLYFAEKARLYAAADGDGELYACYASMHCWLHLMAAYTDEDQLSLSNVHTQTGDRAIPLSSKACLDWAKKLRNHALLSYAAAGQAYYYQIKEKSGLPTDAPPVMFGSHYIDRIPAIYETQGNADTRLCNQLNSGTGDDPFWVLDMSLLAIDPKLLPKLSPNHPKHTIYLFGTNACYLFFARGIYLLCSSTTQEFEESSAPIDWEQKLTQAMRLLNLAWAIAEEGGDVQRPSKDHYHPTADARHGVVDADEDNISDASGEETDENFVPPKLKLTRSCRVEPDPKKYVPPEVGSVRDLYPRRVTEIADLGKIFAAACMVLRLRTVAPDDQSKLMVDLVNLLDNLHNASRLNRPLRALLARQRRYNGHLSAYLSQAKQLILDMAQVYLEAGAPGTDAESSAPSLDHDRDALLKELFNLFLASE